MKECWCQTSWDVYESRPEVGSSRKMSRGSLSSAIPMLHRLACPPADQAHVFHVGLMAWLSTEEYILKSSVSTWRARQAQRHF